MLLERLWHRHTFNLLVSKTATFARLFQFQFTKFGEVKYFLYMYISYKSLCRLVTVDETWIHWYTTEAKKYSKHWTSFSESASKKAKPVIMTTVFRESKRVMYYNGHRALPYRITELKLNCGKQLNLIRKKCSSIVRRYPLTPPPSLRSNWSY